jgi:hypothetical protein
MKHGALLCFLFVCFLFQAFSVQPLRKPFVELFIAGKQIVDGSVIEVNKGDRFTVLAQMKGGRSDFVQLPDTYADFGENSKIVSRGYNKLIYDENGKEYQWELVNDNIDFESDNKIKLALNSELTNKHQVEVIIPAGKVDKSYIKITLKTAWKFSDGTVSKQEENIAEAVVHLRILGNPNEWYASPNLKATGTSNPVVEQKLNGIQDAYLRIDKLFSEFNFNPVQAEIRGLQNSINELKSEMLRSNAINPVNHTDVLFIGLPSDRTINDIDEFSAMADAWNKMEKLVIEQKDKLANIEQSGQADRKELLLLIKPFSEWQQSLPTNTEVLLSKYVKDLDWQNIVITGYLSFDPDEGLIKNLKQCQADLHRFFGNRMENIASEKQKLAYAHTRLQAVKIFDGMLMGLFSSINFATWENQRE